LPRWIQAERKTASFDTPENRFVKIALREILNFCEQLISRLSSTNANENRYVIQECREITSILDGYLANGFFTDISPVLRSLPLASAVMQQKRGYREFLQLWVLLGLASRLGWDGANDLFAGGKKDVATLYEYWVFFKMYDICKSLFEIKDEPGGGLFSRNGDGIQLNLKIRNGISFFGTWEGSSSKLNVRFSFNRTFVRLPNPNKDAERSHPNPGSWTRSMRPDYTISFWPRSLTELEAEQEEAIVHLHFDAKYRIERVLDALGFDLDGAETIADQGAAKRSDLLKMHAYKDAIRRSGSAFVIFPGNENMMWREYIDVLPGLGAFSLRPGSKVDLISEFLSDAATNLSVQWKSFAKC
jgi:predicted component of viral defense system (DUF524 family)